MNTITRLDFEAPDIVRKATSLSESERAKLARSIAALACERADVVAQMGERFIDLLADPSLMAETDVKERLAAEADDFDDRYFKTMDETEDGSATEEGLQWFARARAVASLNYAIEATDLTKFCEAVYEAHAAIGNWEEIRALIDF
ncbi:hypothetical protein FHX57_001781 [Paraburkholderia tropica]|uniref:hypothetical protein n=1 Tax=Paraburkholderia tropica TaxID=92647 RepID=UPI00160B56A0|nr:hypothetical protein [Paraburkholderia tropica]MBB2999450.1 hypothetical protein [Paraburkholderia tropica]MBB6317906.1 hypothetical protein [Paraburkholderia tropica]